MRVNDAHQRFRSSPLSQVNSQLEKEVVVSSIFGANSKVMAMQATRSAWHL